MIKRLLALLVLAISSSVSWAQAVTYTYTSPTYPISNITDVSSIVNCGIAKGGTCVNFTTAQRITGSFTIGPLAPNLALTDISGQVSSFSFSDGITTYANADSLVRVGQFSVRTDSTGAIDGYTIEIQRWQTTEFPHLSETSTSLGSHLDSIRLNSINVNPNTFNTFATHNGFCSLVGTSQFTNTSDLCTGSLVTSFSSSAETSSGLLSSASLPPPPPTSVQNIPTVGEWGLMLLSAMLALGGVLMTRRRAG